jgi:hypothetical protein
MDLITYNNIRLLKDEMKSLIKTNEEIHKKIESHLNVLEEKIDFLKNAEIPSFKQEMLMLNDVVLKEDRPKINIDQLIKPQIELLQMEFVKTSPPEMSIFDEITAKELVLLKDGSLESRNSPPCTIDKLRWTYIHVLWNVGKLENKSPAELDLIERQADKWFRRTNNGVELSSIEPYTSIKDFYHSLLDIFRKNLIKLPSTTCTTGQGHNELCLCCIEGIMSLKEGYLTDSYRFLAKQEKFRRDTEQNRIYIDKLMEVERMRKAYYTS